MATPSNLWGGGPAEQPHCLLGQDRALGRRRARRMSRRFARVGVGIPATRLQQISVGAPTVSNEMTDVRFALVATETQRQERFARRKRGKRRGIQCLVVAALILAGLNLLICTAYVLMSVLLHESPL